MSGKKQNYFQTLELRFASVFQVDGIKIVKLVDHELLHIHDGCVVATRSQFL